MKTIFVSGKYVVFYSGFCVAKGLVELEDRGVYGGALINKRQCWPRNIPGNDIEKHLEEKRMGAVDCLEIKTD